MRFAAAFMKIIVESDSLKRKIPSFKLFKSLSWPVFESLAFKYLKPTQFISM